MDAIVILIVCLVLLFVLRQVLPAAHGSHPMLGGLSLVSFWLIRSVRAPFLLGTRVAAWIERTVFGRA